MKRSIIFLVTVLCFIITFSGCKITTHTDRSSDADAVSSIQIYDLRDSSHYNDFLETDEPVYTIEEDQKADFLSDLGEIRFSETIWLIPGAWDPSFRFDDWTVRINYSDGSYMIFSCGNYAERYDQTGEVIASDHYGCEQEQWDALIEKYVPEDVLNGQT